MGRATERREPTNEGSQRRKRANERKRLTKRVNSTIDMAKERAASKRDTILKVMAALEDRIAEETTTKKTSRGKGGEGGRDERKRGCRGLQGFQKINQ